MAPSFRVVALVSAFNEEDVIAGVIGHLIANGVETYLLDNHSTDKTVKEASRWLGKGLLKVETFPAEPSESGGFDWTGILQRKEALSREIKADWFIHHDADEIRESPWPGFNLTEAIRWVDGLGYSCINFRVFNFPPVDDGFRKGKDLRTYFTRYEPGAEFDLVQNKCWKANPAVSLVASGGHDVAFEGRRVFPIPFILRHYPVRSQTHGLTKVFAERRPRFLDAERRIGWHRQYDGMGDGHQFIRDPETLTPFDLDLARLEVLRPDADLELELARLRDHVAGVERDRDLLQSEIGTIGTNLHKAHLHSQSVEEDREALRVRVLALVQEIDGIRRDALAIEADREEVRQQVTALGQELERVRLHTASVDADRDNLRQSLADLTARLGDAHRHASAVEADRDGLRGHIETLAEQLDRAHRHGSAVEADRDDLRRHVASLLQRQDELIVRGSGLEAEREYIRARAGVLAAELEAVHHSGLWRIARSLRLVPGQKTRAD